MSAPEPPASRPTRAEEGAESPIAIRTLLEEAIETIAEAGCSTPEEDADLLIADALGMEPEGLTLDLVGVVTPEVVEAIDERVSRRAAREPVAYILGRCSFRAIEVAVDERVLIPREETGLLVEAALELPEGSRVHEVGTGSGAVALSILHERPDLRVTASDLSPDAAAVARENAERLGLPLEVTVARGLPDWLEACDLVVANLPYLTEDTLPARPPEVRREPTVAVSQGAGPDGLGVIRELIAGTPSGWRLAMEHDTHHGETMRSLLREAETRLDFMGGERVTVGRAP